MIPVVPEDEVAAGGDDLRVLDAAARPVTGLDPGSAEVRLLERLAVHQHAVVVDPDTVAGQADHALDEIAGGIQRVLEDDDVAPLDGMQPVVHLGGEHQVAVVEGRVHRAPHHSDRLDHRRTQDVEAQCEDDDLHEIPEGCLPIRPGEFDWEIIGREAGGSGGRLARRQAERELRSDAVHGPELGDR